MNLKNYTTEVPSLKSILRIEELLVQAGCTGIQKEYDDNGKPTSLVFRLKVDKFGPPVVVKLPANVPSCHETMWRDYCKQRNASRNPGAFQKTSRDFEQQADRVAWRIMQDWVEIQLSLIKIGQIDTVQAFLSYCYDGTTTVYERVKAGKFAALLPPAPEPPPDQSPVIDA